MKREEIEPFLYQHGRITGLINGHRKQLWGVITQIEENCLSIIDHDDHFFIFFHKDIRGFKPEAINLEHKEPLSRCDCGCTSTERYTCERCGKSFCGDHGHMKRIDNINQDICSNCLQLINN